MYLHKVHNTPKPGGGGRKRQIDYALLGHKEW